MLSASLAVEGHTHNYVYPAATPAPFRHQMPSQAQQQQQQQQQQKLQKQQQHNLQQHQLHTQYLHQQYLAHHQQNKHNYHPQQQQQQQQQQPQSQQLQHHRTTNILHTFMMPPPPPSILESWRNDLVSVASVSKPFIGGNGSAGPICRLPTTNTNTTNTSTSGSFFVSHTKQQASNVNAPEFLIPQVPMKTVVQNHKIAIQKQQSPTSPATNTRLIPVINTSSNIINSNATINNDQPVNLTSQIKNHGLQTHPSSYFRFCPPSIPTALSLKPSNASVNFSNFPSLNYQSQPLHFSPDKPNHILSTNLQPLPTLSQTKSAPTTPIEKLSIKVPPGKEGSLKHRILTRISPNGFNPVIDCSMQAEDLSMKSNQHTNNNQIETIATTMTGNLNANLESTNRDTDSIKKESTMLSSFLKGSLIKLANGEVRKIEELTTNDFLQSAKNRSDFRLLESTIVKVEVDRTKPVDIVNLTVSYNDHRSQKVIPAKTNHPFFVYGRGWASFEPELTLQSYGFKCNQLCRGDIIVSLQPYELFGPIEKHNSKHISTTTTTSSSSLPPITTATVTCSTSTANFIKPNLGANQRQSQLQSQNIKQKKRKSSANNTSSSSSSPTSPAQHNHFLHHYPPYPATFNHNITAVGAIPPNLTNSTVILRNNNNDTNDEEKKAIKIRRLISQDSHNNNMTLYLATSK